MITRALILSLGLLVALLQPGTAQAGTYHMLLGSRLQDFDHPPILEAGGRSFVSLDVLPRLGLNHNAKLEAAETETAAIRQAGAETFRLADNELQVSEAGQELRVVMNGKPLGSEDTLDAGFGRYLSASAFAKVGLRLAYDGERELPQLVGRVYRVNYDEQEQSVTLAGLTPLSLREELSPEKVRQRNSSPEDARSLAGGGGGGAGRQPEAAWTELTTLILEGAYFGSTDSMDLSPGGPVSRIGFKNVDNSGRSYLYIKQKERTGFNLASDSLVGFARIRFGNYFQLASYRQTSSGEISVNVKLGAPAEHKIDMLSDPPRLVMDFEDVRFDEASKTIGVGIGHVQNIRVGVPGAGRVRVVVDLSDKLDYRVLSKDNGARLFVQFIPPARQPGLPSAQRMRGRAVMLDAGHGGSDPGAIGVVKGTTEAANNLVITRLLEKELEARGYTVLQTRGDDRFVSLGQRGDYANYTLPYIFVSIHCNAMDNSPDMKGAMTFHHPFASRDSRLLAESVQSGMVSATGAVDKGVREADFFVLRETVMPAILIECGFMSNRDECALLASADYQRKLAAGIAAGIDSFMAGQL